MFNKRVLLIGLSSVVVVSAVLVTIAIVSGFAKDVSEWGTIMFDYCYVPIIQLEDRLPNTILAAEIIAVVDIESVSRGVEKHKEKHMFELGHAYRVGYSKTLEFTFEVEQYLKGAGEDRIVGLVFHHNKFYNTALGAAPGEEPDTNRKTYWDDRKAVVFLEDRGKDPELNWKAGRYWMAETDEGDFYSIHNSCYNPWLPATQQGDSFLLTPDYSWYGEPSPDTITLDELKSMVSSTLNRNSPDAQKSTK